MRTYQRGFEQNSLVTIVTFILLYVMVWFAIGNQMGHIMFSPISISIYASIMMARLIMLQIGRESQIYFSITSFLVYSSATFWSVTYSIGLITNGTLEINLLIIIFLMGIAAAGAIGLSKNIKLTGGFLFCILVPSSIFSYFYLEQQNVFIASAFAMYFVYLLLYSRKYYFISQENLKSKTELQEQKKELEESQHLLQIQNDQLGEALEDAKAADKAKSMFLAIMSHEIRTPLNGIVGMSHLLNETKLDMDQQKKLGIIEFSAETLINLVNDILDFSKIEAGKLELDLDHFHLENLIKNIVELFQDRIQAKGLNISYHIESSIPTYIFGDQIRIRQILINLINNAIKFTEKGKVEILISQKKEESGLENITLKMDVVDTGIGISQENQAKLFQAFTQSDASFTRKFGGTGLGLAISKRLSELMGGEIGVESQEGDGSTFFFTIVVKKGEKVQIQTIDEKLETTKPLHILLAEDNKVNVLVARQILEKAGHTVEVANNGMKAVELFQKGVYDLILMDIMMPEMDGVEATWVIRQMEREYNKKSIPIIALTANVVKEDQKMYISNGMNDFLSKPIRPDLLLEKIASLTESSE